MDQATYDRLLAKAQRTADLFTFDEFLRFWAADRPDRLASGNGLMPWLVHLADQGCLMLGIGQGSDGLAYDGLDEAMKRLGLAQADFEAALARLVKELDNARELVGIVQPSPH